MRSLSQWNYTRRFGLLRINRSPFDAHPARRASASGDLGGVRCRLSRFRLRRLAIAFRSTNGARPHADSEKQPHSTDREPASVSLAWAELQDISVHEDVGSSGPQWLGTSNSRFVTGEQALPAAGIVEPEVPQWLLTAVSSENARAKETP
jgi:hypothetical protein